MAQIMEPQPLQPQLLGQPRESQCHIVRPPGKQAIWLMKKDECRLRESLPCLLTARGALCLQRLKTFESDAVYGYHANLVGLGVLLDYLAGNCTKALAIRMVPFTRSTSRHLSAHSSPRRAPVATATLRKTGSARLTFPAASKTLLRSWRPAVRLMLCRLRGGGLA
jgi:hypothetical protein